MSSATENNQINGMTNYKILLTNARSLSPKINSLHDVFNEHCIDFALITESWLKDGGILDRDVLDLEHGTNMKIIYRNQSKKSNGRRKVGGGVSIIFNLASCSFRERKIARKNFELVAAVGRVGKMPRTVAVFCVYIEPSMKAADLEQLNSLLSEQILAVKAALDDPILMIGGDLNRRDLTPAFDDFDDIRRVNFDATRGDACLDVLYSNAIFTDNAVWPLLENAAGIRSDHGCVIFQAAHPKIRDFSWTRINVRKHTERAVRAFGDELARIDWLALMPANSTADHLVDIFEARMSEMTDRLFPIVSVRKRTNDKPSGDWRRGRREYSNATASQAIGSGSRREWTP